MSAGVLIGAYERDNFGDLLFLSSTREVLGELDATATAPFAGDTTALGGEQILRYAPLLDSSDPPFLWVVGGETGSTSIAHARAMTDGEEGDADGAPMQPPLPDFLPAYLPRPSRFSGTRSAHSVINSVGLSGAALLVGARRIETIASLREATFLSVRDLKSVEIAKRYDLEHRLAPDLVHTIREHFRPSGPPEADLALVQGKARYIREIGVPAFVSALLGSRALGAFRVRLFSAGEAPGHDSRELLAEVASAANSRGGSGRFEVSAAETAGEKVDEIATAGLWVGTSLHGFIISTAFGRPRVGLTLPKLESYAKTWTIDYPAKAELPELDAAVSAALDQARRVDPRLQAERLSRLAAANAEAALASLSAPVPAALSRARAANAARVERSLAAVTPARERIERYVRTSERAARRLGRTLGLTSRGR